MVFSKLVEAVSASVGRLSAPKSSTLPHVSSGLSPPSDSSRLYGIKNSGKKNNLRPSSSLQDFSSYSRIDPELGDHSPGTDDSLIHLKQAHLLERGNGGSSFSKEKGSPKSHNAQKKWVCVLMVLLCLVLLSTLVFALQFLYTRWSLGKMKYHVVLDCGSTGTRVYVYQASFSDRKDGSLPILLKSLPEEPLIKHSSKSGRAYNRMETEPGFDKLVHNIAGLRKAIKPLIKWAEKQIPRDAHKATSLYLYATAGVRRLPSSDSQWLLNNAYSILKTSPFLCQRESIKIISGMEEAYYGWIALNYHTGVLGSIPKQATFGALDLGGSSLQVTFESNEKVQNETSLKLSIGPVNHHLTAYSLSGYGLNDAFDKSVLHLLKKLPDINNANLASGNIQIKHPCLQSGYKEKYFCSQCNSVYQDEVDPRTKVKIADKNVKAGFNVQLIGDPKWEECRELAKVAVNLSEWSDISPGIDCEVSPCALSANLPRPYGKFYAMSGFFVVYRFFNLSSDAVLDDVLEKGQEFCSKSWKIAKKSVRPQPFIEQYCFRAPYVVQLLRDGLHITDNQLILGSGSITWTLGVALLEAGKSFSATNVLQSLKILQKKIDPVIFSVVLLASILLVLCALSCIGIWTPRFLRRPLSLFRQNSMSSTAVLNIPTPFRLQRWSPLGDNKVKMPLSPTVADAQYRSFGTGNFYDGSGVQLSAVSHSYSSSSLGQMQIDNSSLGPFWAPHRSQMHLQSRRSQSREDLNSSLAEAHLVKV